MAGEIEQLTRNAVDVLPEGALEEKLRLGRPLRVKLGIDVTSPDIHVGRGVPLQRMRAFQDAGHVGVLIVGDYTTRIGDPSGRSAERPILTDEQIEANARTYVDQALQLLDPERTEVRYNGEWLSSLTFADVVRLTRTMTVARLLERDDFAKRYAAHEAISVSELLYPLMQGYDSVAIEADVELGGTDQLYNPRAGGRARAAAAGGRSAPSAGGPRRACGCPLDERGAAADRPGRRTARRRGRVRARRPSEASGRRAPPGRKAPFSALDSVMSAAIIPRLPREAA